MAEPRARARSRRDGKLERELDEWLGLNKPVPAAKKPGCPYGQPPKIEMVGERDWTVNGVPRKDSNMGCQIIQMDANACATCPLIEHQPDTAPSDLFRHTLELSEFHECGAVFRLNDLSWMEWQALKRLKRKRAEKEARVLRSS